MNQKVLVFEPNKCVGCRFCEQWCSFSHFEVTNPSKACIHIERDNAAQIDIAKYCHQCLTAPCIDSCEFDALSKDDDNGTIIVNRENCTGCQMCIEACPYEAPVMHPEENFILICDLCGGEPECVKHCPEHAILYTDIKNLDSERETNNA
jgi:Fe-S-cluster-containing dehydrogenase component